MHINAQMGSPCGALLLRWVLACTCLLLSAEGMCSEPMLVLQEYLELLTICELLMCYCACILLWPSQGLWKLELSWPAGNASTGLSCLLPHTLNANHLLCYSIDHLPQLPTQVVQACIGSHAQRAWELFDLRGE